LLDNLLDDFLVQVLSEGKYLLNLFGRDGTTTILVEHLESSVELVVGKDTLLVHCGNNKLGVVDFTTAISVALVEHIIDLFSGQRFSKVFGIAVHDLFFGELTITVDVHGTEDLVDIFLLLL